MLLYLLLIGLCGSRCAGRLVEAKTSFTAKDACGNLHCLHLPQERCPTSDKCLCQPINPNCTKALICCNIANSILLTENLKCAGTTSFEALHIRNITLDKLDLSLNRWNGLRHISITNGNITHVSGKFNKLTMISCLNLSSNGITKLEERSLANLFNLSVLDLSNNNLSELPTFTKAKQIELDISGNENMLCSKLFDVMKTYILNFKNANKSMCLFSKTFNWFNTTEKVPLPVMEQYHESHKDCTENCSCELYRVDFIPGKVLTFNMKVNCFGLNLTTLPLQLPPNTISLNVSNNNITSLKPLIDDPSYENLRELYADNNQITSILPLEGSKFIEIFSSLSLRNNKIDELPLYFVTNIFDRKYISKSVKIGLNKLKCDCNTAKVLRVWLLAKKNDFPDYDEIYCENNNLRVIDLDPFKLCQSKQQYTDYIYYIIAAEVLLLIFLIAKVSYDYWVFKTAGYLPWPASKMPKLPCDCLCE